MHESDSIDDDHIHPKKTGKQYRGKHSQGECFVTVNGCALDPRFDLRTHSPNGFEWGYGGTGPAQLALALLADWLGDDALALDLYQAFKFKTVASLPREGWTLTGKEIDKAISELRSELV